MSSSARDGSATPPAGEPNHLRRFVAIWIVASLIATPLVAILLGPDLPPGKGSDAASGQVTDNTVLLAMATPVLLLVVHLPDLRGRRLPPAATARQLEGPAVRGHAGLQTSWIVVTLRPRPHARRLRDRPPRAGLRRRLGQRADTADGPVGHEAAGAGDRAAVGLHLPLSRPTAASRRPTSSCPVNTTIEFHVTSLDVIHSFWAYQLGVKADANPGVDNIAFVKPTKIQTFEVHCAELCGIWHGGMFDHGHVVSGPAFERWIAQQRRTFAPDDEGAAEVLARPTYPNRTRRGE